MTPQEFLIFMCRVTYENFKDSEKMLEEPLHVKLDQLLPTWLAVIDESPAFTLPLIK
jgi:hypothetical protein